MDITYTLLTSVLGIDKRDLLKQERETNLLAIDDDDNADDEEDTMITPPPP